MSTTEETTADDPRRARIEKRLNKRRKIRKKILQMATGYERIRKREQENTTEGLAESAGSQNNAPTTNNECTDIQGTDRACCNAALLCFNDLQSSLSDLDPTQSAADIRDTCRTISDQLRRDKLCVKASLGRCVGPGRMLLQSRFDTKARNLYDQFYQQCASPVTPATQVTTAKDGNYGRRTTTPNTFDRPQTGNDVSSASTAGIIAGAVVGSIAIIAVVFILVLFYRRKRATIYSSDSSTSSSGSSSHNSYDVKRSPNPFVPQAPPRVLGRSESNHYAEIDDRFVDASYKPELPPNYPIAPPRPFVNAGYLAPENDVIDGNETDIQQPIGALPGVNPPTYLELEEDPDARYYEKPVERRSAIERSYVDLNRDETSSTGYTQPEVNQPDASPRSERSNAPDKPPRTKLPAPVENVSVRDSTTSVQSGPHTYFVLEPTNV